MKIKTAIKGTLWIMGIVLAGAGLIFGVIYALIVMPKWVLAVFLILIAVVGVSALSFSYFFMLYDMSWGARYGIREPRDELEAKQIRIFPPGRFWWIMTAPLRGKK